MWKKCYSSKLQHAYDQCDFLYANNSCFDISDDDRNFEVKSFDSVSTLIFTPTEPSRGCFGCLAHNKDGSALSFTAFMFKGMSIFDSMP